MRGKKYLLTLFILMFLASMAKVSIPATSSPTVTFKVDPLITTGAPVNSEVMVNVSIETDPGDAIVAWAVDIKVDPDVLKPGYYVTFPVPHWKVVSTSKAGYFLYDWCVATGWDPDPGSSPTLVKTGSRNETTGTITGYSESTKNWYEMLNQPGNGTDGNGTVATFHFTSLNETAWSPIEITAAYYFDSWVIPAPKRTADVTINGHYNVPEHDVAVTDISAPSDAMVGDSVPINVSVWNLGANNETFNLEVSANTTLIENRSVSLASNASGMESFTWNTAGMDPGNYNIKARAILATDLDSSNDERTTTIELKSHDVAVTDVSAPAEATVGDSVPINVTVANLGSFDETFNVKVSYGTTLVETQPVTLTFGNSTTIPFSWNTTDVPPDTYTITAEAILAGDVDLTNNEDTTTITVKPVPEHDIAIIDVVPPPILEVDVGDSIDINVTIKNEGNVEESFTVNLYADGNLIGNETDTLAAGSEKTYSFTWNTAGMALGTYTITAEASVAVDEDPTDNTITTEWGIDIVPEFPTLIPLLLALAVLAVSTIVLKRRQRKPSTSGSPTTQP